MSVLSFTWGFRTLLFNLFNSCAKLAQKQLVFGSCPHVCDSMALIGSLLLLLEATVVEELCMIASPARTTTMCVT